MLLPLSSSRMRRSYGHGAIADAVIGGTLTGGMRKFVDRLPGLGPAGANNLGQYIPVGCSDTATAPTLHSGIRLLRNRPGRV